MKRLAARSVVRTVDVSPVRVRVMLDQERAYFAEHRQELAARYPGNFVVIKGSRVTAFPTETDALAFGAREYGLTAFLVRNVNQPAEIEVDVPAVALGVLRGHP